MYNTKYIMWLIRVQATYGIMYTTKYNLCALISHATLYLHFWKCDHGKDLFRIKSFAHVSYVVASSPNTIT